MQTFLPYADYIKSAEVLDRQRLGKQRVEVLQMVRALAGISKGWTNHPATKMWQGHALDLIDYGQIMCLEWVERGYKDTCFDKMEELRSMFGADEATQPSWIGDDRLHSSHRSSLLRKAPEHYRPFWPTESDSMEYWWPTHH